MGTGRGKDDGRTVVRQITVHITEDCGKIVIRPSSVRSILEAAYRMKCELLTMVVLPS